MVRFDHRRLPYFTALDDVGCESALYDEACIIFRYLFLKYSFVNFSEF